MTYYWLWSFGWSEAFQVSPLLSSSSLPFHVVLFGRTHSSHPSLTVIWNSSVWEICLFSPFYYIQALICISIDSWIFYTTGYKPILIIHFLAPIVSGLAIGDSFIPFVGSHDPLTNTHHQHCRLLLVFILSASMLLSKTTRCSRFILSTSCPSNCVHVNPCKVSYACP